MAKVGLSTSKNPNKKKPLSWEKILMNLEEVYGDFYDLIDEEHERNPRKIVTFELDDLFLDFLHCLGYSDKKGMELLETIKTHIIEG